jgi:hypothetical protein
MEERTFTSNPCMELTNCRSTLWNGHVRHDFTLNGREALVVEPEIPLENRPWIWRAEFFDAYAQVDMQMLSMGWHLAYYHISDLYGCPQAIELMNGFQTAVQDAFHVSKRAVLLGFSRGGLYAFNYAAEHPDRVTALYLDAPVLDIRSWPGGKGAGSGSVLEWEECLRSYGLSEEDSEDFPGNPLNRIDTVVAADIPIVLVAGELDEPVPYPENGAILVKRYRELGGKILEIVKSGCGHHPHSLEDPSPIIEFLNREAIARIQGPCE